MSSPRHRQADVVLRDGSTVNVRPVRAEDAPAVRAFFERLSPRSIALRFFCGFPDLDRAAGWETEPDRPGRAEVAFAIADAMQHNGLGTILLGQLIEAAAQAGVAVLSAEVLPQNQHMLHVFGDSGIPVTTHTLPGVVLRSEEHTSELQSHSDLVCRLLLEKKKKKHTKTNNLTNTTKKTQHI